MAPPPLPASAAPVPPPPPAGATPATPPPPPPATSNEVARGHDDELAALLAQISDDDDPVATSAPAVGSALTKPTEASRPTRPADAPAASEGGIGFDPEFASFGSRAIGLIVDWLVLDVFLLVGFVLVLAGSTVSILLGIVALVAGFVAATVVYSRQIAASGQSFGNRVANSKVVDARNGHLLDSGAAATRYALRFLVSPVFFFGFVMALASSERRTFHDQFAGSVVTRPARASWSIDDEATTTPPSA